ncbi:MAG: DMT family transporter [Acidimicrobiales bacterium]
MLAFSFTFPATVLAERVFDPTVVGAGRSVIAAVLAVVALRVGRVPWPARRHLPGLLAVAGGCGIGFGLLSALALHRVTSSHAAVVVGLLPAATAAVAVWRGGDRPGRRFWLGSAVGTLTVIGYALARGAGSLQAADLLMLAALGIGAVGYASGGRLARSMPGWQVVAWGVVLALPVSLPVATVAYLHHPPTHLTASSMTGLAYVGVVSMFVGFIPWYRGMAQAGVARASQLQLGQPLLTIAWSAPLLGDHFDPASLAVAGVVAGCVLVTQRTRSPRSVASKRGQDASSSTMNRICSATVAGSE